MPPSKNIRDAAAARAAVSSRPEPVPELPEALASEPRSGMQRGREIAARYGENPGAASGGDCVWGGNEIATHSNAGDAVAVEHGSGGSRECAHSA